MRQHSIIRHAMTALTAYLVIGVAMAQSGAPPVSIADAQRGAVAKMTDRQAVLAVTRGLTQYLGAEEFVRQLMLVPKTLGCLMNLTPEALRKLLGDAVR